LFISHTALDLGVAFIFEQLTGKGALATLHSAM